MIDLNNLQNMSILLLSLMFAIFLFLLFLKIKSKKIDKKSHVWRKKSATNVYRQIQKMKEPQIFAYLRKIDPFVFEELILYSLSKRKDVKIVKANRYTGDGGIDGTFFLTVDGKKRKILIQAKRYQSHINKKHVEEFCDLISNDKSVYAGYFVHTGKTGAATKDVGKQCAKMKIYSGKRLIELLLNSKI